MGIRHRKRLRHSAAPSHSGAMASQKKPAKPSGEQLYGSKIDAWYLPEKVVVPVDDLEFDTAAAEGQIRLLEQEAITKRMGDMRNVEPTDLLECVLWNADLTGVCNYRETPF